MFHTIRFLFVLPIILLFGRTAFAQNPQPQHTGLYWHVAFWNNMDQSGSPVLTALHQSINWDWGYGSPDQRIQKDQFSGRWTGNIISGSGTYRFTVTGDDGVRVFIDNQLVIDEWREQQASTYIADVPLTAGPHLVIVDYFEKAGLARLALDWTPLSPIPTPTPPSNPSSDIIIDDGGPGFLNGGSATAWRASSEGYGGNMIWTRNNDRLRLRYNWARWYPGLAAGRYEVFAHIPRVHATTRQARYWISHYDGFTLRVVNQGATSGWISLGTYRFHGDGRDYVSLADVTFEPYISQQLGFDAVKWVRRS